MRLRTSGYRAGRTTAATSPLRLHTTVCLTARSPRTLPTRLALAVARNSRWGRAQVQPPCCCRAASDESRRLTGPSQFALFSPREAETSLLRRRTNDNADSFPINHIMKSHPLFTRREMLGVAGMAGLTALAGMTPLAGSAAGAVPQTVQARPRIACIVSFWGAPGSHADWIIAKLMDGYWWQGAHTPSRVDVVSVYIHQFETSLLGQKDMQSEKHIRSIRQ